MIASIFNTLALAYVANAAIVLETAYETHYFTVTGTNGEVAVTSTASLELPKTTAVTFNDAAYTLTLDSAGNYEFVTAAASASATATSAPAESATSAPSSTADTPSSTSSTAAASSTSSDLSDFANECLNYHNQVRAIHQAPAMVWDETLASYAQNYLNGNCNFAHSGGPYGENIAMGYGTPTEAMQAWYDENSQYDYAAGQYSSAVGHFTQMVWVNSHHLGCYQSDCGSSGAYLVCEYSDERGNILGAFTQNVLPPKSS